ncbi:hypothetical protein EYF80_018905 [Liparis tanakae]|uniref:Uncharacterized protein n=1 Tax=Liparis tanakae TaxID=230148 RepID=A0A4Z2HZE9_9TELE|nr:hypothetical protein EYF80_018905 [Liparis tanakae]
MKEDRVCATGQIPPELTSSRLEDRDPAPGGILAFCASAPPFLSRLNYNDPYWPEPVQGLKRSSDRELPFSGNLWLRLFNTSSARSASDSPTACPLAPQAGTRTRSRVERGSQGSGVKLQTDGDRGETYPASPVRLELTPLLCSS